MAYVNTNGSRNHTHISSGVAVTDDEKHVSMGDAVLVEPEERTECSIAMAHEKLTV